MRNVYLLTAFCVILLVTVFGLRGTHFTHPPMDVFPEWAFPGMKRQAKFRPQSASVFFAVSVICASGLPSNAAWARA